MMLLLSGRWTPWFSAVEAGPGRLCFWVASTHAAGLSWDEAGGDAMVSLWGFRCDTCRAEFLVRPGPDLLSGRTGWSPPVLCCNQPLRRLEVTNGHDPDRGR
jgi:hypothetical protein